MLQVTQQQYERMDMLFGEVKDYMDRQVVVIANLQEGQS